MAIQMFNPGKDDKTMFCPHCQGEFKLLFGCNGCSQPVCAQCGLLRQPGQSRLVPLEEIGIIKWFETKDDPLEMFFCPTCR